MKIKKIAFIGDSFTWGEGLELYIDTPQWISERGNENSWMELMNKQSDETIAFRENHRFANIVAEHFNSDIIIDDTNGGSFVTLMKLLLPIYNEEVSLPEFIIIQFSAFQRNPIHFHFGSYDYKCKCELCDFGGVDFQGHYVCFYHLYETVRRKYVNNEELDFEWTNYFEWMKTHLNLDMFNLELNSNKVLDCLYYLDTIVESYSVLHLQYFINKYVKELEKRGTKIFFIDSWTSETSKIIQNCGDIKNNLIPLKMFNNTGMTDSYSKFELSFPYQRIQHEFPKTQNGHPTIIQHEYIANSIISRIKNYSLNFI